MASTPVPVVLAAFTAGVAVVVLPAWAPFLLADRVRALFSWPTRSLAVNYLLVGLGVALAQSLTYLLVLGVLGGVSSSQGPAPFFGALFGSNLLVPLVGWSVATVALPRRGAWDPTANGLDGRLVLAAGGLWYAVVVSVAGVALAFLATFLFLPV